MHSTFPLEGARNPIKWSPPSFYNFGTVLLSMLLVLYNF